MNKCLHSQGDSFGVYVNYYLLNDKITRISGIGLKCFDCNTELQFPPNVFAATQKMGIRF
jgi:hypothetical protein